MVTGDRAVKITTLEAEISVARRWSTSEIPVIGATARAGPGVGFLGAPVLVGLTWKTVSRMPDRPAPTAMATAATRRHPISAPSPSRKRRPPGTEKAAAVGPTGAVVPRSARATKASTPIR